MKKLLFILLLALASVANATTYYVCTQALGSDAAGVNSGAGTSKSAPWSTAAYATTQKFSTMAAGDRIALCDGGTFTGSFGGGLANYNATATNPVGYTDYQPTGTLAPLSITFSSSTSTSVTTGTTLSSGAWNGLRLQITAGTGRGTDVAVTTNTTSVVNVAAWPYEKPDSTSVMVLRQARPIVNCSSTNCFIFDKLTTLTESNGYLIQNLDLRGGDTVQWGILFNRNTKHLTVDNVAISHFTISGIQSGVPYVTDILPAGTDGKSSYLTVKNSNISYIFGSEGFGLLVSDDHMLIDNNRIDHVGQTSTYFDHSIYLGGASALIRPQTISSMTGNGTTVTVVTSSPHGLPNKPYNSKVSVTGGTGGTGTFTTASANVTYVNATTFTYPATGNGTYTGAAYTALAGVPSYDVVVRNNTITNASPGALGTCGEASIVVHGQYVGLLIENNIIREDAVNNTSSGKDCYGIAVADGGYSAPEAVEGFVNTIIRGNYIANYGTGIGLDLCDSCLIENNYVYSAMAGASVPSINGIAFRAKNFSPTTNYGTTWDGSSSSQCWTNSTACAFHVQPHNVTIRNNTVYLPNATGQVGVSSTVGIQLNANIGDLKTGSNFRVVSNIVVLGSGTTSDANCFNYSNMTAAMFDAIDYNVCYTSGGSAVWAANTASGTVLAGASLATFKSNNATFDQHSLNTNPTLTAPVSTTTPPYVLPITTGSTAYNAGHPSKSSPYAIGGKLRSGTGAPSIGAFEPNATTVLPGAPTNPR